MRDKIEILVWKVARWFLIKGYGEGCEMSDIDEQMFASPDELRQYLKASGRCGACRAKEVRLWIENHVDLLTPQ